MGFKAPMMITHLGRTFMIYVHGHKDIAVAPSCYRNFTSFRCRGFAMYAYRTSWNVDNLGIWKVSSYWPGVRIQILLPHMHICTRTSSLYRLPGQIPTIRHR